VYEVGINKGM